MQYEFDFQLIFGHHTFRNLEVPSFSLLSHSVMQHDMRPQTTEIRLYSMPCAQVASQYLLSWWGLTAEYEVPQLVTYAALQT